MLLYATSAQELTDPVLTLDRVISVESVQLHATTEQELTDPVLSLDRVISVEVFNFMHQVPAHG